MHGIYVGGIRLPASMVYMERYPSLPILYTSFGSPPGSSSPLSSVPFIRREARRVRWFRGVCAVRLKGKEIRDRDSLIGGTYMGIYIV